MAYSILITGASGFVGSHLVEAALAAGMEVWAGMRTSSSRQWLQDERINFITLSLNDSEELRNQLSSFKSEHGGVGWDYVVHAAGATKAADEAEFMHANSEATGNLVEYLCAFDMVPRRFVLMSSLSASSMGGAAPDTTYGRSKLAAEQRVKAAAERMDSVILRPTGVYGPRERDYFLMAKSIKRRIDFAVGFKPQYITFIYVKDLCAATMAALHSERKAGSEVPVYPLSDGAAYTSRDFSLLLQKEMGVRRVLHITAPLWLLKAVCCVGQWWGGITHKMTALNKDKYNILKRRDWRCDISQAVAELGYRPAYTLERGVAETVAWYKKQKWI
ncbi:MAG: NAD(P)-dependent oxidoreductase [Bacteroidaceae bacterium]|nr:NAD(P)-dependent oxidoreductase [Bacteroidaceae bacterium]